MGVCVWGVCRILGPLYYLNIARGTTDPEIDSVTWTKFTDHIAWSPNGTTCSSCKFGHQMAPLALFTNLATRWRQLHQFQIWPPDGATCIGCKFGHQMAPHALVANLATRWRHLHWLQIWPPDGTTCISWLHQLESSSVETVTFSVQSL